MKKLLAVVLVLILIIIAVLPIIGNKVIESELKDQIEFLTSNGIEISDEQTSSSYLKTAKHYEFMIKDSDRFSDYLANFSNSQLTPYIKEMLEGTKLATDIEYYNLPVDGEIAIDIYLVALSNKLMENIKKDDARFASYVKNFFQKGGLKYHMNLNVKTKEFKGYIKDIDEIYEIKKGSEVHAKLLGSRYSGKGNIFIPESMNSKIEHFSIDVKEDSEIINILFENISSTSAFESRTTYASDLKFKKIFITTKGLEDNLYFDMTNSLFDFSSNSKGIKTEINLNTKFDNVDLRSAKAKLSLDDFVYDMRFKNIDKDAFEKLIDTLSEARTDDSAKMQRQIKGDFENILSRGIDIKVPDLSVKSISLGDAKKLKGFSSSLNFILPENTLTSKVKTPLQIADKIKVDLFLKISKELFVNISKTSAMIAVTQGFAKESADDLVYDVKLDNGSLSVNGKAIR